MLKPLSEARAQVRFQSGRNLNPALQEANDIDWFIRAQDAALGWK